MKRSTKIAAATLITIVSLAVPMQADPIAITYSLSGMGTVESSTPTTLTLIGQFSGSVLSGDPALDTAWNPVKYSDQSVANLTTGLLNGNFSITFADGDTLVGNVFEDVSSVIASPSGTGPFTQTWKFTGGTGEFAGATGSASGKGFVGTTIGTVSGSGVIDTAAVPEPAAVALLVGGLVLISIKLRRPTATGR